MEDSLRVLLPLVLLAACTAPGPDAPDTTGPVPELTDAAWTEELLEHREKTREAFETERTSPMAASQRLTSEPTDRVFLTREDRTFALADAPDPSVVLVLTRQGTTWTWEDLGGATCTVDEEPVVRGSALEGPAGCDVAGLHLGVYPYTDHVTVIVYDPERPEMKAFEDLLYFPPDRGYAVPAELVRVEEPDEVEMLTSRGLKKTFHRFATIRFQLDGKDQELTAFKYALTGDGSESLFVPFRDGTSGRETYGAGRYLDLDEPETTRIVLDFNRAYNPLCNYSPGFNCPIPPPENRLKVAIPAGERTYPH